MIGGNKGPVSPDSLPDAFLVSYLRSIGEPWAPQNVVNFLRVRYTEHAYDPNGEDRFLRTLDSFAEDLLKNPITVPDGGRFSDAFENRYIQMLHRSLPAGSPRRILMDSVALNFGYVRRDLDLLANENTTFSAALGTATYIENERLKSARGEDELTDLLTIAQGWRGHFEAQSRMFWAGLINLLKPEREVLVTADVSRFIRRTPNLGDVKDWEAYLDDTIVRTPLNLDEEDDREQRAEIVRNWLGDFVDNVTWQSTGHAAVRNSLSAMLEAGRSEPVQEFLQLEAAGLGNLLWAAVHLATPNYRLLDDTLLSIFELTRQDTRSSLGYEMGEYLDANIALYSAPSFLAVIQKFVTAVNHKLADRSSPQNHWLREPAGLVFLTDFYHRLLIQNGTKGVDARLMRILATQDMNDIRARLIKDVMALPAAEREANSKALATLENASLAEMLDTEDPETFPFARYTGLISRRSLPPTTNGAAGANGAASGSTPPPPPFAARSAVASTVTGLIEDTGETSRAGFGVAAPLFPARRVARQRVERPAPTRLAGTARTAFQARNLGAIFGPQVRPTLTAVR